MAIALRHNDFGHFRVERGGKQNWALRAACHDCGETEDFNLNNGRATLSQELIEKNFANRGWFVGKDRRSDRCPKCLAAERAARKQSQDKALAMIPTPQAVVASNLPSPFRPRSETGRPIDWKPTPAEVAEMLKDRNRAIGSNPHARHPSQTWYPALSRGEETLVRSMIETRLGRKPNGCLDYEGGWTDEMMIAAVNAVDPNVQPSREMIRMVRVCHFGQTRVRGPNKDKAEEPKSKDEVILAAPGASSGLPPASAVMSATPTPAKPATPASAPSGDRMERMEQDLLHLFGELEALKTRGLDATLIDRAVARLDQRIDDVRQGNVSAVNDSMTVWAKLAERMDALEGRVKGLGAPAKTIDDYTISELLAEIAKRTAPPEQPSLKVVG